MGSGLWGSCLLLPDQLAFWGQRRKYLLLLVPPRNAFLPTAAVAPGLTLADSELVAATLIALDKVPRGLEVQLKGGLGSSCLEGRGGTGGGHGRGRHSQWRCRFSGCGPRPRPLLVR